MQLTQEYFDKGITNLMEKIATKEDLAAMRAEMVTKADLKVQLESQTEGLKAYVHQAFETHQAWTQEYFNEVIVNYDLRDRVVKLEKDEAQLKLHKPAHI